MERLRDEFVQLVEEEAQISNEIVRNKAEITDLSRRQSEQDESVRENLTKFEKISQDLSEAQENLNTVKKEIETLLAKFEEGNQAEKKQAELERLAQNKMYDYLQELNQHKARLTSLQNIRESHSNLFAGVRAVMQNAAQIGGVIGVVSDLLTFDPKYTTAIDIALGGGSQNVVTEDENAAKRAIAFLREKRLGRATFLPLTTIKGRDFNGLNRIQNMTGFVDLAINLVSFESRLHKAMSSLLGTTVIVDSGENATAIARAMNYNVRIVTLDGTQINPGGSYAGGAGKRNSTTFTSVEISNLEKQIKSSEEQLKISEKEVQKAQSARQELLKEIELLKTQGEEKRFVEQSLNLKIEQLTEQKVALEQLTNLSANQEATGNLLELTKENEHKVEVLAKITERKAEIEKQLEEVKTNSQAHKALQSEKTSALNQAQLRQSEVASELKFTKADEKRLLTDLSALTEEKIN